VSEKTKIFVLADHPFTPSGVGTQTRYFIEALLKTGRYSFVCLGGAIKHENYQPMKTEEWGDDWIIFPVNGYGNPDLVRSVLRNQKPDMLWFMTDPRFWTWLWEIDNEVRTHIPMVYHHVWDNKPYPYFNKKYYQSNDEIVCISKVTHDIVQTVAPEVNSVYLPHAVNGDIFKPVSKEERKEFRNNAIPDTNDKFLFFWNNRNARRKQSGTLVWWFKEFLDRVGHDKASLLMHTDPSDPHGQDLRVIIENLGLNHGQVYLSTAKVGQDQLAGVINMCDCTINIADAEGFGLATLESLSCGVPIIVNMTGGLQEQVTDGENWFGIGIEPNSKAIIGSQDVPYIYEDRIGKEDFINALTRMIEMPKKEYNKMAKLGRKHVQENYNFDKFCDEWVRIIDEAVEKHGSWDTRKSYTPYRFTEIK
jgi:glycosyltransferase involved in cell wall biosynthesis